MEDLTGRQFGPYQIVGPLGEGGMAAVYKAYQPAMDRYVALKVLPRQFAKDPEFVARFQREARLLAQLQHPHILPVFDYGEADGFTYLVMPFVPSGTLMDLLKGTPLPLARMRTVIAQVGDALDYAHARGMIHRDVKPSNVLLDERGNCLLTDFGLARMTEASVNLTSSGTVMGTPAYMSPEQGSGGKIDARSDIYSLGVILYELATGRVPYKAETPIAVIFKHMQDPLPPARELNPRLPEAVERVILKSLAKHPEDRFQTAGELVRAIQAAVPDAASAPTELAVPMGTVVSAPAPTAPLRAAEVVTAPAAAAPAAQPRPRVLPAWAWAGIGLIVLAATVGGLWAIFGRTPAVTPALPPAGTATRTAPAPAPTSTARPANPPTAAPAAAGFQCGDRLGCVTVPPGEPIHIAYVQDLSGNAASLGRDNVRGIELAIQAQGRLLGHDLRLTGEDSRCTADGGARAAEIVAADPSVVAVLGTTCSSEAQAAIPILADAGLVMISSSNTNPDLTNPDNPVYRPGYFRTAPNDRSQGIVAAQFTFQRLGVRRAVTLHDGGIYGQALQQIFANAFQDLGGSVAAQVPFDPQWTDFRPVLREVAGTGPELLYLPVTETPGAALLAQHCDVPALAQTIVLGADGLFSQGVFQQVGPCAADVFISAPRQHGEAYDQLARAYQVRYNQAPTTGFVGHSYDAARLVFTALEAVAVQDPDGALHIGRQALRDALYRTRDFPGVTGVLTCMPNGDCVAASFVVYQITEAEITGRRWPPPVFWDPEAVLPGREVRPLTDMAPAIPWLPLDSQAVPVAQYVGFNMDQPPFDNPLVRRAFAAAVDRQALVDLVASSGVSNVRPATSLTPPGTLGRDLYGVVGVGFNPDQARAWLAEAGYPGGRGFPVVAVTTNPGVDDLYLRLMNAVAEMWRQHLQARVEVVSVDSFDEYLNMLAVDPPGLFRLGWTADRNDPDEFLNGVFHSAADGNYGGFRSAEFDSRVDEAARITDPAARQALYLEAEQLLCETAVALIPLVTYTAQR